MANQLKLVIFLNDMLTLIEPKAIIIPLSGCWGFQQPQPNHDA